MADMHFNTLRVYHSRQFHNNLDGQIFIFLLEDSDIFTSHSETDSQNPQNVIKLGHNMKQDA